MEMSPQRLSLSLVVLFSLMVALAAANPLGYRSPHEEYQMPEFLRGRVQFDPRKPLTCTHYPGMCSARWMPGPDCCRGLCVNLKFDPFNCGSCGRRCGFGQVCCGGRCANVMFDNNNCGWCGNRCEQGASCTYGMCNYGQ